MDETTVPSGSPDPDSQPGADALIRQFVEHWGMMARAWGINPTMGSSSPCSTSPGPTGRRRSCAIGFACRAGTSA